MPSDLTDDLLSAMEAALEAARVMVAFSDALAALRMKAEALDMRARSARATPAPLRDIEDIVAEVAGWPTYDETGAPLMEPGPIDEFIRAARRVRENERRGAIKLVVNNNEDRAS